MFLIKEDKNSWFFNVKFHNSKMVIVDFVPEFHVEKGECAQSFCAQTLLEDQ